MVPVPGEADGGERHLSGARLERGRAGSICLSALETSSSKRPGSMPGVM
jgi:hypothetical protein